jgi:hypothetical protein
MPPDGYQPITYYNDTIKQDVGVLYNPITGDVKSDGSYVSDMLASPDMAKHFGEDARKSVEQKYVADMTPALQRPDALDMAQTSKPAPNMRADALDLPQTSKNFDLRENVPVLYNNPEENDFGQLDKVEEAPLLADFTSPMPTGARLDPYMNIPKVEGQDDPVNDMVAGENLYPYTPTPDGHHRMPDGSIMPDSEMKKDGVLGNNGKALSNNNGVLNTDTTSSNDRKGSAVSANARGSMMPFAKIDRNEALIRIGGAMVGGSSQGYTGAMKAATAEYGNIQDANRLAETNAFNKAEATRLAEERIAALKAKGSSKTTDKDKETFNNVSSQLNSFQSGLDAIAQSKAEGGNLTGVGGIFKSFIDNYTGSPDAARRLLLSRLKVDDALLRVAETKGAISNKEMDLFLQPAPKNFQDEQIWVDWINERMVALRNVQNRLNGNVVINESEQSYRYRAPTSNYKPVEVDGFTIQQK